LQTGQGVGSGVTELGFEGGIAHRVAMGRRSMFGSLRMGGRGREVRGGIPLALQPLLELRHEPDLADGRPQSLRPFLYVIRVVAHGGAHVELGRGLGGGVLGLAAESA
jgi:hypothetical protein